MDMWRMLKCIYNYSCVHADIYVLLQGVCLRALFSLISLSTLFDGIRNEAKH